MTFLKGDDRLELFLEALLDEGDCTGAAASTVLLCEQPIAFQSADATRLILLHKLNGYYKDKDARGRSNSIYLERDAMQWQ